MTRETVTPYGGMRYRNAELDGYIDRYFVTIPWPERMQVAGEAIRHITSSSAGGDTYASASALALDKGCHRSNESIVAGNMVGGVGIRTHGR